MKQEIIIAGFGGQGVLSMGKILAYSGLMEDKEVTWMPAYGPEQRGGTANVTVIVSDERISSPILKSNRVVSSFMTDTESSSLRHVRTYKSIVLTQWMPPTKKEWQRPSI